MRNVSTKMKYEAILITGGLGFVGSNFAVSFKKKYPDLCVLAMDNLKRRGSELNLSRLREAGVDFVHGDIRCPEDFPQVPYGVLIECSAEPSVLAGFDGNPRYVVNTNLSGTINCLEEARKRKADIVFLSSSRVYPYDQINALLTVEAETRFVWEENQHVRGWSRRGIAEDFPLDGPRSLYGASKLSSELMLQEYIAMYGLRGVVNRCGVIAGPWQFGKVDQGVFTLWMMAHYFKRELRYIGYGGKGKQVRDLVHVDDLFDLVDHELSVMKSISGKVFNIGGGKDISLSLLETTNVCAEITGNRISITSVPENRPADLIIYLTDGDLVNQSIGWKPVYSTGKIMQDIYEWIRNNELVVKRALT